MPTYKVSVPVEGYEEYFVVADSADEAVALVKKGDCGDPEVDVSPKGEALVEEV